MADYLPKFTHDDAAVTFAAEGAVTGGLLVEASGDRQVATAGADSAAVVGVAGFDAADGEDVVVYCRPVGVHSLIAAGAIAAGAQVISAVGGEVATIGAGTNPIGVALTAALQADDVIDVLFI